MGCITRGYLVHAVPWKIMLQILEAISWPRGLPRANMSKQHEKSWFRSLTSHVFVRASCQPRVDIDTRSAESSLTSHTFARTSCRPEPERCRFLVDVAQKSSKKFCRGGGKWWQMVADGNWSAVWLGPASASQNARSCQNLSEFVKWFHHALPSLRGRRSGYAPCRRPPFLRMHVCGSKL